MQEKMSLGVVLVVEDELLIADLVEHYLLEGGFEVLVANDGQKAQTILEDAQIKLHALVSDIRLPVGPNGWELARLARERHADLPVVYMSGDSACDWTKDGVPKSIMLQKPFAPSQIVVAVAQLTNEAGPRAAEQ